MAKNLFETRKRVSHFQKTLKDIGGENELIGCKDYVSSIIQDMDSNFSYIQSGCSKKGIESNEKHFTSFEDSFLNIPLLQMPVHSSSKDTSQTVGKYVKPKKYSFSRKFPLMEKSQKILKQLKHNQNIPKPRAHLAAIPKSPAKNKTKAQVSVAKRKEVLNVKNKITSNPHCKVPSNHSAILNIKSSDSSKISKELAVKHSKSKKIEDKISGKGSFRDIPAIDTNTEANSILEFDSGTSDSEYERFVKKNKKGLQKKSSKMQKKNSKKSKSGSKSLKRKKLTHVSEQKSTYDCDNVTESSRSCKISPFKKQKRAQAIADFKNDLNCSDPDDIPDVSLRDSSSESEDDSVATSVTQQIIPKTCEVNPITENVVLSGANSSESNPNLSVLESNNTEIENSVQFEVKQTGETEIFSGSNLNQSGKSLHVLESHLNSDKVQSEFLNENPINSIKIEPVSLPSNLVIDICDSDDECNNGELNASGLLSCENVLPTPFENCNKNLVDPDSEESDVEIIEVKKPVQTVDKCSALLVTNASDCLNNRVSSETQLDTGDVRVDVLPLIKTESLGNESLMNILPIAKSKSEAEIDVQHNVVYTTDICHTKKMLEQKTIVSHCSKTQNVPSKGSFLVNTDLKVIKHEIGLDDDIIILDSVHSPKLIDSSNLPTAKTENIKSEPATSESKLKLFDPIDSKPTTDETNEWEKQFKDVIPVSSAELLEWLKMEFQTYEEMKQTNADVEASLRNLQARQAQKIQYVRNLLHKCVKSSEDTKPLMVTQVENPKDSKNFISVNLQNNSDITPSNSFSLNPHIMSPSTAVQDIKPDVDKLKEEMQPVVIKPKIESCQDNLNSRTHIPKIESDDNQTLMLLNEKCSECGKDAVAACQRCAKVFFCSHECGRKFWIDGHVKVCGTK